MDHASGWHDQGGGDFKSRHVYFRPVRLRRDKKRVLALTEFGGYSLPVAGHVSSEKKFGYRMYETEDELLEAVERLYLGEVAPCVKRQGLSAAVYTQLSDVEDEVNGILTYDRRVLKVDPWSRPLILLQGRFVTLRFAGTACPARVPWAGAGRSACAPSSKLRPLGAVCVPIGF